MLLTDELIHRLRLAVISIDPTRRKSGGALLGDRIRVNAINPWKTPTPKLVASRTALPPEGAQSTWGGPASILAPASACAAWLHANSALKSTKPSPT